MANTYSGPFWQVLRCARIPRPTTRRRTIYICLQNLGILKRTRAAFGGPPRRSSSTAEAVSGLSRAHAQQPAAGNHALRFRSCGPLTASSLLPKLLDQQRARDWSPKGSGLVFSFCLYQESERAFGRGLNTRIVGCTARGCDWRARIATARIREQHCPCYQEAADNPPPKSHPEPRGVQLQQFRPDLSVFAAATEETVRPQPVCPASSGEITLS